MVTTKQLNDEIVQDNSITDDTTNQIIIRIPRLDDNAKLDSFIPGKGLPFYNNLMKYSRNKKISDVDSNVTKLVVTALRAIDRFTLGELREITEKVSAYAINVTNEKIEQEANKIT